MVHNILFHNIVRRVLIGWAERSPDNHPTLLVLLLTVNFWQQWQRIMNETVVFCLWFVVRIHVQPLHSQPFTRFNGLLILIPVIALNILSAFSINRELMDVIIVVIVIIYMLLHLFKGRYSQTHLPICAPPPPSHMEYLMEMMFIDSKIWNTKMFFYTWLMRMSWY